MDARTTGSLVDRARSSFGGRRRFLTVASAGFASVLAAPVAARQTESCDACKIVGITGGGVVQIGDAIANVVLFASKFLTSDNAPVDSSVNWQDPTPTSGVVLESSGPLTYSWSSDTPLIRHITGLANINQGERQEPFELIVTVAEDAAKPDYCKMLAGDKVAGGAPSGWGYEAEGSLVGGRVLLLGRNDEKNAQHG